MKTLNGLKKFMSTAKTVEQWNQLREDAKLQYPQEVINQLDCSGYISEIVKKK